MDPGSETAATTTLMSDRRSASPEAPGDVPREAAAIAKTLIERFALPHKTEKHLALACLAPSETGDTRWLTYVRACGTLGAVTWRLISLHRALVRHPGEDAKQSLDASQQLLPALQERLGSELSLRSLPSQTDSGQVVTQLLGALVHCGAYRRLYEKVQDVAPSRGRNPGSYKSLLQEWAARASVGEPSYDTIEAVGPPHDQTWRVRVQVGRLPSAIASGRTKRAAESAAARQLLETAAPDVLLQLETAAEAVGSALPRYVVPRHKSAVQALTRRLKAPPTWAPIVSAALIRGTASAYSKEHRATAGGLAQMGSEVLRAHALSRFLDNPDDAPDDLSLLANYVTRDDTLLTCFEAAGLGDAALLDQASSDPRFPKPKTDCVQALAAIALLAHGRIDGFPRLVAEVGRVLDARVREALRLERRQLRDPKSALQEVCTAANLELSYEPLAQRGPPHDRWFRAQVRVGGAGESHTVDGGWAPSQQQSELACAKLLVEALEFTIGAVEHDGARETARLLMRQLATTARTTRAVARLPLAPIDHAQRRDWLELNNSLTRLSAVVPPPHLTTFADRLREIADLPGTHASDVIFRDVVHIADLVARLGPASEALSTDAGAQLMPTLLRCAAVARLHDRPYVERELADIAEDLRLFFRRAPEVVIAGTWTGTVIEREGFLLSLVADAIGTVPKGAPWEVAAQRSDTCVEVCATTTREIPTATLSLIEAIGPELPLVTFRQSDSGFSATLVVDPCQSFVGLFQDDSGAVAGLLGSELHDLKNALDAFVAVKRRAASTVTEQYGRSYEASMHLDEARRVCAVLLGASTARTPGQGPVDLSELLDGYLAGLLRRRPPGVAVSVGALDPCVVPTSRELVLSAIENLVKNAIEAMAGNGQLGIELTADGDRVRIAISDTGCGLSDAQIATVNAGKALLSTREGGSGLGLMSVQRALASIDASVDAARHGSGTTMTISIPRARS